MTTRARNYCFTLNNYTEEEETSIQGVECKYIVYGREIGAEGTAHLQGLIVFKNPRTFSAVKAIQERAHWEVCRSVPASIVYCKKDGNIYEDGEPPQKNGGDSQAQRAIKNKRLMTIPLEELVASGELAANQVPIIKKARVILAQEHKPYQHDSTRGVWIYGPPGVGKTHRAREYPGSMYIKAQNKWFDGYEGEENIVIDDFDTKGECLSHYMKIWSDKWSCSGEIKGGTVHLQHRRLIVTSNYHPCQIWTVDGVLCSAIERRFEIIHIEE